MVLLDENQRRTLHVLAHLFFKMGEAVRADRFYALLAEDGNDAKAQMGHAACLLEMGDGERALGHLRSVMDDRVLSSSQAPLLLLKSRALWALGRLEESRSVRDEYLCMVGVDRWGEDGGDESGENRP